MQDHGPYEGGPVPTPDLVLESGISNRCAVLHSLFSDSSSSRHSNYSGEASLSLVTIGGGRLWHS